MGDDKKLLIFVRGRIGTDGEECVSFLQFGYAPRPYSSLSREYDPICDPSLSAAYGMDNSR